MNELKLQRTRQKNYVASMTKHTTSKIWFKILAWYLFYAMKIASIPRKLLYFFKEKLSPWNFIVSLDPIFTSTLIFCRSSLISVFYVSTCTYCILTGNQKALLKNQEKLILILPTRQLRELVIVQLIILMINVNKRSSWWYSRSYPSRSVLGYIRSSLHNVIVLLEHTL